SAASKSGADRWLSSFSRCRKALLVIAITALRDHAHKLALREVCDGMDSPRNLSNSHPGGRRRAHARPQSRMDSTVARKRMVNTDFCPFILRIRRANSRMA